VNQLQTKAIILARTEYGEADRIITLLTPEQGKLRLMARGVRKIKSKLAGGIELFSVSDVTYIRGRGEIGTLVSARLETHYGNIISTIERVQLGYDLIKLLNKATEDEPEPDYFELLKESFQALNDATIDTALIRFWFQSQLLKLAGHSPNLHTDTTGRKLEADKTYVFDSDAMSFGLRDNASFTADHIKVLRLTFAGNYPGTLAQIQNLPTLLTLTAPLVQTMFTSYIRV
jgi:DNA repair protein RecO (recombination protein O)